MGRVVRGMGAMGWEGASDMVAACAGAIGRLGVSVDGDMGGDAGMGVVLLLVMGSGVRQTWRLRPPDMAQASKSSRGKKCGTFFALHHTTRLGENMTPKKTVGNPGQSILLVNCR